MNLLSRFCIIILLSISPFFLFSQVAPVPVQNFGTEPRSYTHRQSFWSEFNLSGDLTKDGRWQYQMDYQYRRGSDASFIQGGSSNPFKEIQQQVFRPWIHYWAIPKALRFSLSPVGFWVTWTPKQEAALYPNKDGETGTQSVFPEFRICPQVTSFQNFGRVQFINRLRYEFRFVGNRRAADDDITDFTKGFDFAPTDIQDQNGNWFGNNHLGRFRWQMRVQVPLGKGKTQIVNKTWYVNAWNEVFIANGPHVKNNRLLNQNRVVVLLGYKLNTKIPIKIETGFTYQALFQYNLNVPPTDPQVTYGGNNVENNFAYTIYIICDDFHGLFKKHAKTE